MKDRVRIGIIGCGAIALHTHMHGFSKLQDKVEVVALADPLPSNLQALGDRHGIGPESQYSAYQELIRRDDIDGVSICTPNYLHAPQTIDALRAGKHVLCEKPMATNVEAAKAMVQAAEDTGKLLMVGFTHRYMRHNQTAQDLIKQGAIGKPFMMRVRFAHDGPYNSWSATTDWFYRPEQAGGGALLDMGIHALDICRFMLGDIAQVYGQIGTHGKTIPVEDTAVVNLLFENDAAGYIEVGWSSKKGILGLEIYGSEGTLVVDYATPIRLHRHGAETEWVDITDAVNDAAVCEMDHFIDCIAKGNKPATNERDGFVAVVLAEAVYQSAQTGAAVSFKE